MLQNDCEKNVRHYPIKKVETNLRAHVPIPLPSSSKKDDEWETYDLKDENDWGGLINRNADPITEALDRTSIDDKIDVDENIPAYYHYLIKDDIKPYEWVVDGVLGIGGHPLLHSHKNDLSFLPKNGFGAILTAFEYSIDEKYIDAIDNKYPGTFSALFIPTPDGYALELLRACEFIESAVSKNKPVFVHSFKGLGRAGTIAAAYMTYKNWLNWEEAMEYMRSVRPGSIETKIQKEALSRFAAKL